MPQNITAAVSKLRGFSLMPAYGKLLFTYCYNDTNILFLVFSRVSYILSVKIVENYFNIVIKY